MTVQVLVARNLRRVRVRRGLSQESLAVDAGVDRTYVSRLERGLENPTIGLLDRLATALSVEVSEFFVEAAPGEPMPRPLPGGRRPNR
jgi:transcriptional regulator with XRE-family HTH domain